MFFKEFPVVIPDRRVSVTDPPYCAVADGKHECRPAIQQAIDDMAAAGGGTVVLPKGRYLSASLTIRNHVEIHFEDGAVLKQTRDPNAYVRPLEDGYEEYHPQLGHNWSDTIKWSHVWYLNYPMIFAQQGCHDFKVTGNGTIDMMDADEKEGDNNYQKLMRLCPIGFYQVSNYVISDVTITNYHSYAIMPFTTRNGLFSNLKINKSSYGNGDGICLMNSQNIRVTGCDMDTGDDSVYIFASYRDPRGITWWTSELPQPSVGIEIDHNHLVSRRCKAYGMILWGIDCPDQEKVEVRDVHVHDNYFKTMGNWLYCPYTDKRDDPPVTRVRFENNKVDAIEINFFETQIADMSGYRSTMKLHNGDFKDGRVFWSMDQNEDPASAGVIRPVGGTPYGYIRSLEKGRTALYQGLWVRGGSPCRFSGRVRTSSTVCRLFVRDLETGEEIASKEFCQTEFKTVHLDFTVPKDGNYHIGMEGDCAKGGSAQMEKAWFIGNMENAYGYDHVLNVDEGGKIIFFWEADDYYKDIKEGN
ncbi:MAG: right-handed parallel beta-helix repeat-containing protein [Clostridia bacterium]|nr:right-handed parallel beta-helix repeat-containing protein [Clostridia bacterium]